MSQDIRHIKLIEPTDKEVAEYRSISGWAVVGLILGLLSPLALVDPLFWCFPIVAIIVNCAALRKIMQDEPAVAGRKAALAGLWMAVLCIAAAPTDWFYYRWRIKDEARQAASFWFELLAKNQPEMAFELTLPPQRRHQFDKKLLDLYKYSDKVRKPLEDYYSTGNSDGSPPLAPTLLKLGTSADVRFIRTLDHIIIESLVVIEQLYSVSYAESGERKILFFKLRLSRMPMIDGSFGWRILDSQTGIDEEGKKPS